MTLGCFAGFEGFDCAILWIVMVILFFLGAIVRKQLGNLLSIDFSLIGSTIATEIVFIIAIYITKSIQWAFILALAGMIVGGIVGTKILGEGGEGGYE